MLPRIPNHLLCCLLCFMTPGRMYHNKEFTEGGTLDSSTQVWLAHHNLGVVDYKSLIGLSLQRVPHFCARCGASLKDLNPDTTSVSKTKCFLISRWNMRKYTNIGKPLELWEDAKWGRPARRFGLPATPWAHWSVAFAHCLLVSGAFLGWHLF
jgi:hypothetical protein